MPRAFAYALLLLAACGGSVGTIDVADAKHEDAHGASIADAGHDAHDAARADARADAYVAHDAGFTRPTCDCNPKTEYCAVFDDTVGPGCMGGTGGCYPAMGCAPLPGACADAATCACIQKAMPSCFCTGSDGGMVTSGCYQ